MTQKERSEYMEKKNKRKEIANAFPREDRPSDAMVTDNVERWPVFVCGVQGEADSVGTGFDVVVRFTRISQQDAMRICTLSWNRSRLWPFSQWRASCDFQVREMQGPMGEALFDVAIVGISS